MRFFDGAVEVDEHLTDTGWAIELRLREPGSAGWTSHRFEGTSAPGPLRDWAFLTGTRRVHHRRRTNPLERGSSWVEFDGTHEGHLLCDGAVSVDEAALSDGVRGLTLRIHDRERDEWSIHWVNSRVGRLEPPVRGRFDADGEGRFDGVEELGGRPVHVRFRWSDISDGSARWRQWFSFDGGTTWEHNWEMVFTR